MPSPPVPSKVITVTSKFTKIPVHKRTTPSLSRTITTFKFPNEQQSLLKPHPNTNITQNGNSEKLHSSRPQAESCIAILRLFM